MATKQGRELAGLLDLEYLEAGGPFGGTAALGTSGGFPLAAEWCKREKQSTVAFLVRFRKGTLKRPQDIALQELLSDADLLKAVDQKKFSSAERKAAKVLDDRVLLFWDYSFKAPSAEKVAGVARRLSAWVSERAESPGGACDLCTASSGAALSTLDGDPTLVCPSCGERIEADNQAKQREWDAVEPAVVTGLLAGLGAAVVMALAWGGLAYGTQHIYALLAIGMGLAVAWSIRIAMRKVNLLGKIAAVVFTLGSVMAGDFFFFLLSLAQEAGQPPSWDLARKLAPHFFTIEFSEASGYLSLLFGVLGAVAAVGFLKGKPVGRTLVKLGGAVPMR